MSLRSVSLGILASLATVTTLLSVASADASTQIAGNHPGSNRLPALASASGATGELRRPTVPGQGSNRILAGKGRGNVGASQKVQ
jgi:hypothetical protein